MKICIGVNHFSPSIGGAEKVVQTIVEYLAQFHEVFVFTRKVRGRNKRAFNGYRLLEYTPGDLTAFNNELKSIDPDVFMVYSDMFDFFRPIAIQRNKFKLIVALCGANWLHVQRNYVQNLYRNSGNIEAIICHSKHERDYRLCQNDKMSAKVFVIPNGVHLNEFDDNNLNRKYLAPNIADKKWIVNVSNFFPGKGQEHAINIISQLPNLNEFAYIQICSDMSFSIGEQLQVRWNSLAEKLRHKGTKVELKKNLKRDEVIGFLKQSNVFLFTSEKEVAPLVLLESMAASLPWIATNVGNAEDLHGGICIKSIKNSRYHSVFDQRVKQSFINGIQELCNKPKIGELGRSQIEKELTWDKILPKYRSIIECGQDA